MRVRASGEVVLCARRTTESSMFDHDFGHLCRGRRIHMSGHSEFGMFTNIGTSSVLTGV